MNADIYSDRNKNNLDLAVVLFWNVLDLHKTSPVRTTPSVHQGPFLDNASGIIGEPVARSAKW
jgi:hypothetical protein